MERIFDVFDPPVALEYSLLFKRHDVSDSELPELTMDLLREIGIDKLGHRLRLLRSIKDYLQNNDPGLARPATVPIQPAESHQTPPPNVPISIPNPAPPVPIAAAVATPIKPEPTPPPAPAAVLLRSNSSSQPKKRPPSTVNARPSPTIASSQPKKAFVPQPSPKIMATPPPKPVAPAPATTPTPTVASTVIAPSTNANASAPKPDPPSAERNLLFPSDLTEIPILSSRDQPNSTSNHPLFCLRYEEADQHYHQVSNRAEPIKPEPSMGSSKNTSEPAAALDSEEKVQKWIENMINRHKILVSDLYNHLDLLERLVTESFRKFRNPHRHQQEAVTLLLRNIVENAMESSPSSQQQQQQHQSKMNYLLQHAAGSGKSLTIACLADFLIRLAMPRRQSRRPPVYDLVLIVSDRVDLVEQLQSTLVKYLFESHGRNPKILSNPTSSENLIRAVTVEPDYKQHLIVTTLQKFGSAYPTDDGLNQSNRRIAIIVDEAHRSQGQAFSRRVHDVLTGDTKQSNNLTYFCFTCTPKKTALRLFGTLHTDDGQRNIRPFHTYSMRSAIQDNVVLNVLKNYQAVSAAADLTAKCAEDKVYPMGQFAASVLVRESEVDANVIESKAQYIVQHFREILQRHRTADFVPKAMVVAPGRHAILLYKRFIEESIVKYLPEIERFDVAAVFSPFEDSNKKLITETDAVVNGPYATSFLNILDKFRDKQGKLHMLIVADKLQTGFDEPMLTVMYIDKILRDVKAVQTLCRLSRPCKGKTNTFVVDFLNQKEEFSRAFSLYWNETTMIDHTIPLLEQEKFRVICDRLAALPGVLERDAQAFTEFVLDQASPLERKQVLKDLYSLKGLCNRLSVDCGLIPVSFVIVLLNSIITTAKERLGTTAIAEGIIQDVEIQAPVTIADDKMEIGVRPGTVMLHDRSFDHRGRPNLVQKSPAGSEMTVYDILRFVKLLKSTSAPTASSAMSTLTALATPVPSAPTIDQAPVGSGYTVEDIAFLRQMLLGDNHDDASNPHDHPEFAAVMKTSHDDDDDEEDGEEDQVEPDEEKYSPMDVDDPYPGDNAMTSRGAAFSSKSQQNYKNYYFDPECIEIESNSSIDLNEAPDDDDRALLQAPSPKRRKLAENESEPHKIEEPTQSELEVCIEFDAMMALLPRIAVSFSTEHEHAYNSPLFRILRSLAEYNIQTLNDRLDVVSSGALRIVFSVFTAEAPEQILVDICHYLGEYYKALRSPHVALSPETTKVLENASSQLFVACSEKMHPVAAQRHPKQASLMFLLHALLVGCPSHIPQWSRRITEGMLFCLAHSVCSHKSVTVEEVDVLICALQVISLLGQSNRDFAQQISDQLPAFGGEIRLLHDLNGLKSSDVGKKAIDAVWEQLFTPKFRPNLAFAKASAASCSNNNNELNNSQDDSFDDHSHDSSRYLHHRQQHHQAKPSRTDGAPQLPVVVHKAKKAAVPSGKQPGAAGSEGSQKDRQHPHQQHHKRPKPKNPIPVFNREKYRWRNTSLDLPPRPAPDSRESLSKSTDK